MDIVAKARERKVILMRLVDADALLDKLKIRDLPIHLTWEIQTAPTIDAVPVVRCRECRNGLYSERYGNVVCCVHHWTRGPKYYCGDGKRREDSDR